MGQLTSLGFVTAKVNVAKGEYIVLRAIAFDDVIRIARSHGKAFDELFARVTRAETEEQEISLEDSNALAASLLGSAPAIAADIIAFAADDPEAGEFARRLPFPVQMECLQTIASLTFTTEEGPKKLLETVLSMARGATSLVQDLRQPKSGSTDSAGR